MRVHRARTFRRAKSIIARYVERKAAQESAAVRTRRYNFDVIFPIHFIGGRNKEKHYARSAIPSAYNNPAEFTRKSSVLRIRNAPPDTYFAREEAQRDIPRVFHVLRLPRLGIIQVHSHLG